MNQENKENKIKEKVDYCLHCKVMPCAKGCPLGNAIPEFIGKVKLGELEEAYQILTNTTVLPSICGRICPHEKQCQGKCIRGIKGESVSIGEIEAYLGDIFLDQKDSLLACYAKERKENLENQQKKVAVLGAGPSGLSAAAYLARRGFLVTIYEKEEKLGGILRYGIPDFRLDKEIVSKVVEQILALGIQAKCKVEIGKDIQIQDLEQQYDAIFVGLGANVSSQMQIEGEDLIGVLGGNELLRTGKHPNYEGKSVAVIGGGNVAMDAARTIKRLGAKDVTVIYRRAEEQMPAEKKEIAEAKKEGVHFLFQHNIVKILGNEKQEVSQIECIQTKLVAKEGETRLSPVNIEGSNQELPMDYVVMAVGSKPEEKVVSHLGVEKNKWGYLAINENYQTSKEHIFAGGDLAGTKATVAWASSSGREAAKKIEEYLTNKK